MGVNGRPTRACALSTDNETPSTCDQPIEPQTPNMTTAATKITRFKLICFIAISFYKNHLLSAGLCVIDPSQGSATIQE
jgi:hypothetical protein